MDSVHVVYSYEIYIEFPNHILPFLDPWGVGTCLSIITLLREVGIWRCMIYRACLEYQRYSISMCTHSYMGGECYFNVIQLVLIALMITAMCVI